MTYRQEFLDTQNRIKTNAKLLEETAKSISGTTVYMQDFTSLKSPHFKECKIEVTKESTFEAVRRLYNGKGVVTALNFANPFNPGGGVEYGANAQEECLCRMSNLFECIKSDNAKPYYDYNKRLDETSEKKSIKLSSDLVVFSPDVIVFKKEEILDGNRVLTYTDEWVKCHVVTCAAPCFAFSPLLRAFGEDNLEILLKSRIKNILEVCIQNDTQKLVLGAFGCGVFNNPPQLVAKVFKELFSLDRYKNAFSRVVFAVLCNEYNSANYDWFYKTFME